MIKTFENFDQLQSFVTRKGYVDTQALYDMSAKQYHLANRLSIERMTTFENYLKELLIGKDVVFDGWNVQGVDTPNIGEEKTFFIKVKNVHITKTGNNISAIYFIDDEDNVYRSRCSGTRIIDKEKEEEIRRKKEEIRLKNLEFDPYDEENWGEEYESKNYIQRQ